MSSFCRTSLCCYWFSWFNQCCVQLSAQISQWKLWLFPVENHKPVFFKKFTMV